MLCLRGPEVVVACAGSGSSISGKATCEVWLPARQEPLLSSHCSGSFAAARELVTFQNICLTPSHTRLSAQAVSPPSSIRRHRDPGSIFSSSTRQSSPSTSLLSRCSSPGPFSGVSPLALVQLSLLTQCLSPTQALRYPPSFGHAAAGTNGRCPTTAACTARRTRKTGYARLGCNPDASVSEMFHAFALKHKDDPDRLS